MKVETGQETPWRLVLWMSVAYMLAIGATFTALTLTMLEIIPYTDTRIALLVTAALLEIAATFVAKQKYTPNSSSTSGVDQINIEIR